MAIFLYHERQKKIVFKKYLRMPMKLSMSWIFDHIDCDFRSVNIKDLVDSFNRTTAEIESCEKLNFNLDSLVLGQVISVDANCIILHCPERHEDLVLPMRSDVKKGSWYLLTNDKHIYRWAQSSDCGGSKEGLLPDFYVEPLLAGGLWKQQFGVDWIIEVDNKSITNRPDLWGHRGFAREMAAILGVSLKPLKQFTEDLSIDQHDRQAQAIAGNPITVTIKTDSCRRFAGLYIDSVTHRPSSLGMALRLMRVGVRPISFFVDVTNYVMCDVGQPMHAFDAHQLTSRSLVVRLARSQERLTLIDGAEVELTDQDIIIADGGRVVSLAGIMGGRGTGVSEKTQSILFESANFNAGIIRKSALRHKIRTEASMRFEKSLDPNQNIVALKRLIRLLDDEQIVYRCNKTILSVGPAVAEGCVDIDHLLIEKKIGTEIPVDFVVQTLSKLEFKVTHEPCQGSVHYQVIIPTMRATKDINIQEDIIEEVARFWGYNNIPYTMPTREMMPFKTRCIQTKHDIKLNMAFALGMNEVNNYPLYDEEWLVRLGVNPTDSVNLRNYLSENNKRLVTSLIPNILKNVEHNKTLCQQIRFFELARTWRLVGDQPKEQQSLAGIFWTNKLDDNFYASKSALDTLFLSLRLPVKWGKAAGVLPSWYDSNRVAFITLQDKCVGIAGMVNPVIMDNVAEKTSAFIFELDAELLVNYQPEPLRYSGLSKYPYVWLDVSMFAALDFTVDALQAIVKQADEKIYKVELKDVFEKPDWGDKRSVTLRFYVRDWTKTLEKSDIDQVYARVKDVVAARGIEIR
jgi:phenylalanyl-tRNA synthetase beta chain